jgi:hypothetical protein
MEKTGPIERAILEEVETELANALEKERQKSPALNAYLANELGITLQELGQMPGATGCLDDAQEIASKGFLPAVLGRRRGNL